MSTETTSSVEMLIIAKYRINHTLLIMMARAVHDYFLDQLLYNIQLDKYNILDILINAHVYAESNSLVIITTFF